MQIKLLCTASLLALLTSACETTELVQPANVNPQETTLSSSNDVNSVDSFRNNLMVEERLELSLGNNFRKQVYTSYGFAVNSSLRRTGSKSARFEMRKGDGKVRSEILLPAETNSNRWYSMSYYLPGSAWASDFQPDGWEMLTQWHALEDSGEKARFPPLALVVSKGRLNFIIYWASRAKNSNSTIDGKKVFDLGPVEKDKWLDLVYHINFSHQSDGELEVWKNGEKVLNFKGPNSYNDDNYPYLKVGLYKRGWNSITKRILYVDDIRVGNGNATYSDMAPSGSGSNNPPKEEPTDEEATASQSVTLKLINANNNQPLQTLTDGATVNLGSLPTTNLNIEATTSSTIESVSFNLTGTKTQSVIESSTPYALFGDKGGNFKSWTPAAGNYKLSATAYKGTTGGKRAGATTTVNFKVVNTATDGTGTPSVTIAINNNAATTHSTKATLSIKAVNAKQMRFYDNSNSTWTKWEAVAATKAWTLSSGSGSRWVKAQVKNDAGKMSASTSDGIILK